MELLSVFPTKVLEEENPRYIILILEVEESDILKAVTSYTDDSKIISDGALVAITLMIAESRPEEKDIMVNLVMNFLTM